VRPAPWHLDAVVRSRSGITLPDRQLACAPQSSPGGREHLTAMACAANFACANRATLAHRVRQAIAYVLGPAVADRTRQVFDVAHNVAKFEARSTDRVR
jgi:tRNA-splicing ligase RtcB